MFLGQFNVVLPLNMLEYLELNTMTSGFHSIFFMIIPKTMTKKGHAIIKNTKRYQRITMFFRHALDIYRGINMVLLYIY